MFRGFVRAVEGLAVLAVVVWVVLLFVNQPPTKPKPSRQTTAAGVDGRAVFADNCATCHGKRGEGLFGPQLAGVVTTKYPNPQDQIAVVTNGRSGMPAFGSQLSAEEIRAVVEFTRTALR